VSMRVRPDPVLRRLVVGVVVLAVLLVIALLVLSQKGTDSRPPAPAHTTR
jgi:hypothetical protein